MRVGTVIRYSLNSLYNFYPEVKKLISCSKNEKINGNYSYINVIIPFNKKVTNTMANGKNDGKNDGKNLSNDLTDNEKRVLLELINNPSIPYDTLVVELGISRRTISRVFVSLVEKGYIERIGTNKKGYWKIIK